MDVRAPVLCICNRGVVRPSPCRQGAGKQTVREIRWADRGRLSVPVRGLDRFEHFFTFLAQRTYPIFGQVFESRAGSNAVIGIAYFGIIYIPAYFAFVLFHSCRIV